MSMSTTTPMSPAAADVLQRALDLEPAERAKVVDKIIESFDKSGSNGIGEYTLDKPNIPGTGCYMYSRTTVRCYRIETDVCSK